MKKSIAPSRREQPVGDAHAHVGLEAPVPEAVAVASLQADAPAGLPLAQGDGLAYKFDDALPTDSDGVEAGVALMADAADPGRIGGVVGVLALHYVQGVGCRRGLQGAVAACALRQQFEQGDATDHRIAAHHGKGVSLGDGHGVVHGVDAHAQGVGLCSATARASVVAQAEQRGQQQREDEHGQHAPAEQGHQAQRLTEFTVPVHTPSSFLNLRI